MVVFVLDIEAVFVGDEVPVRDLYIEEVDVLD